MMTTRNFTCTHAIRLSISSLASEDFAIRMAQQEKNAFRNTVHEKYRTKVRVGNSRARASRDNSKMWAVDSLADMTKILSRTVIRA
jgi:hypothetical protein